MSKAYVLPAAIMVVALPNNAPAQSSATVAPPSVPMPPPVVVVPPLRSAPIYAPPAPPAPPRPWKVSDGGPRANPGYWFTDDDYPPEAKRAGQQGRVAVLLTIATNGMVRDCRITSTSGSASLDEATCRLAMRRGRFFPRIGSDGSPVEYTYPLATRWALSDEDLSKGDTLDFELNGARVDVTKGPWTRTLSVIVVDVDEAGKAIACRSGTPGFSDIMACADFYEGRKMMDPVLRNGKPVRATITLTRSIRVQAPTAGKPAAKPSRRR